MIGIGFIVANWVGNIVEHEVSYIDIEVRLATDVNISSLILDGDLPWGCRYPIVYAFK